MTFAIRIGKSDVQIAPAASSFLPIAPSRSTQLPVAGFRIFPGGQTLAAGAGGGTAAAGAGGTAAAAATNFLPIAPSR